jgi:hypothetical protein
VAVIVSTLLHKTAILVDSYAAMATDSVAVVAANCCTNYLYAHIIQ